jgi:hypothetical protein
MSIVRVQLGGQTVPVQVLSSGFARANEAVSEAAASAASAAASAAAASATLAAAALKANNLSDLTSASTARANLGLGSIATQSASAVAITGGAIAGITDLAVADGGTGASDASNARTNLGLAIGTNVQAYDPDLAAIAALTSAADKVPYATGAGTWAMADLTSFARSLLATASNSAFLTALGQIASTFVDFINAGTGAVTRTVQARMRDTVSAFDFIPVAEHAAIVAGTSTYNATTTLQAAIDTGKTVEFPEGTYQVVGLTMSTNGQRLVALGNVNLQKRANGVILSSSANNIELNGITFRGDAASPTFTGDNISLTGNSPRIINCGSLWASGRALKATGGNVVIHGSNPIWQTTDATASGYDIEIGVSGTATLYHQLIGVYTSQSTGGILMTDTGSQAIVGGQFGKLAILAGTSPAGVNGGTTTGARIIGNVTCDLSNATFNGNAFSAITLTLGAGTSGISLDRSNIFSGGATITNNGNVSNLIELDGGIGSLMSTKHGGSTSLAITSYDPSTGDQYVENGYLRFDAGRGIIVDGDSGLLRFGSNFTLYNNVGATQLQTTSQVQCVVGGNVTLSTNDRGLLLPISFTPASASASGTAGQVTWDSSYIYVCTATNTWKRVAIATW